MNATWSKNIHTPEFLFYHRLWRFDDRNENIFKRIFSFKNNCRIIEIGCGPGALCSKIKKWYPSVNVIGIDNDAEFIYFAKKNVPDCDFIKMDIQEGEIEKADYIVSHTIMEYFMPHPFFNCHARMLKPNGTVYTISVVPGGHRSEILWTPKFMDIMIKEHRGLGTKDLDISHLISRQGFKDYDIIETFDYFGLRIINIEYVPIITEIQKLNTEQLANYRNILEKYQISRLVTESIDDIGDKRRIVKDYYDKVFKEIDKIAPVDLEFLRIISAKLKNNKASAHSYC